MRSGVSHRGRRPWRCLLGPALAVVLWAGPARGQVTAQALPPDARPPTAADFLRRMRTERDEISYAGVRVLRGYASVQDPQTGAWRREAHEARYRVVHADGQTWRSERLEAGPGSPPVSVTIRDGGFSFTGRPDDLVWRQAALPPPSDELADLDLVLRNYRVVPAGTEEVAGRAATVVHIEPRWPDRPSLVLSLDAENHFRLRTQRFSAAGEILSDHFYESIRFVAEVDRSAFRLPAGARVVPVAAGVGGDRVEPAAVQAAVDFPALLPEWLPRGFRPQAAKVTAFRVRHPASGEMVTHHRLHLGYGDGVTSISLFQVREAPPTSVIPPIQATTQHHLHVLTTYRDGLRVTLVGEIGQEELVRMLSSVSASTTASRPRAAGAAGAREEGP